MECAQVTEEQRLWTETQIQKAKHNAWPSSLASVYLTVMHIYSLNCELDSRHERSVWHPISSAAAQPQGGQTASNEHANGSVFSGWGTDVQTPQDAPRHMCSLLRQLTYAALSPAGYRAAITNLEPSRRTIDLSSQHL